MKCLAMVTQKKSKLLNLNWSALVFSALITSQVYAQTAPSFLEGESTTRNIDEHVSLYTSVGEAITATDDDTSDTLTYELEGEDAESFTIDDSTGQISTAVDIDFEIKNSYELTVTVHDGKNADDQVSTEIDDRIIVSINISNLDEDGVLTVTPAHPRVDAVTRARLYDPDRIVGGLQWRWEISDDQIDCSLLTIFTLCKPISHQQITWVCIFELLFPTQMEKALTKVFHLLWEAPLQKKNLHHLSP